MAKLAQLEALAPKVPPPTYVAWDRALTSDEVRQIGTGKAILIDQQTILALIACVRAADAMREHAHYVEDMARLDADYDAARAQLEQSP